MKLRFVLLAITLLGSSVVKAQDQFYSTVDITANILEVSYDTKLSNTLNATNGIVVAGVRGSSPWGSSWINSASGAMWMKLNKTVSCAGQDVENFILLPMTIAKVDTTNYASIAAVTPWFATQTADDYSFLKSLFTSAYVSNAQVKFSKVVCGVSQMHPVKKVLVPVAYIQGPDTASVLPAPTNSQATSAWINGVQVLPANAAPTNAITTMWSFSVPVAATYDVYAHWVSNKNAVSAISYGVDGQAMKNVTLDQNINAGIWVKLVKSTSYTVGNHSINIAIDATANYVVDGIKVEKSAP